MNLFRMMKKPKDKKEQDEALTKIAAALPPVNFAIDTPKDIDGKYQAVPLTDDPKKVIYRVTCTEGFHPGLVIGDFSVKDFLKYPIKRGQFAEELGKWLKAKVVASSPLILDLSKKSTGDTKERLSWKTKVLQNVIANNWEETLKVATAAQAPEAITKNILKRMFQYLEKNADYPELLTEIKKWDSFKRGTPYFSPVLSAQKEQLETLAGVNLAAKDTGDYKAQVKLILDGSEKYPDGGSIKAKVKVIQDLSAERLQEFLSSDHFKKQPTAVQDATLLRFRALGSSGEAGLFLIWADKDLSSPLRAAVLKELVLVHGVGASARGYEKGGETTRNLLDEASKDADPFIREVAFKLMQNSDISYMPWSSKGKFITNEEEKEDVWGQPARDISETFLKGLLEEPNASVRNSTFDLLQQMPTDLVKEVQPQDFEFKAGTLPGIQKFILLGLRDKDASVRRKVRDYFGMGPEKPSKQMELPLSPEEKKPKEPVEWLEEGEVFKRASPLSPKEGIPDSLTKESR